MSADTEDGASDPVEWFSLASTISIAVGIVLIAFGLLVPTNYAFDPSLPARQMESIEVFYFRLTEGLVICLIIGMALVTLGGVIQTGIILHMYRKGEFDPQPPQSPERCEMTALWQGPADARNYGGMQDFGSGARDDTARMPVQQGNAGAANSSSISELQHQQPR